MESDVKYTETLLIIEEIFKILEPDDELQAISKIEEKENYLLELRERRKEKLSEVIKALTTGVESAKESLETMRENDESKVGDLEGELAAVKSDVDRLEGQKRFLATEEKELRETIQNMEKELKEQKENKELNHVKQIYSFYANLLCTKFEENDSDLSGIVFSEDAPSPFSFSKGRTSKYKIAKELWSLI